MEEPYSTNEAKSAKEREESGNSQRMKLDHPRPTLNVTARSKSRYQERQAFMQLARQTIRWGRRAVLGAPFVAAARTAQANCHRSCQMETMSRMWTRSLSRFDVNFMRTRASNGSVRTSSIKENSSISGELWHRGRRETWSLRPLAERSSQAVQAPQ